MDRKATIFGYGTQGRAQALNLRDSGWEMTVVLPAASKSIRVAEDDGMRVETDAAAAAKTAQIAVILAQDSAQPALWDSIGGHLPKHAAVIFAHGYNIHYKQIVPQADLDVLLVAPLCPGTELRERYVTGSVAPIVTAIHQDASGNARQRLRDYITALSAGRVEEVESTFAEETETDLFIEQVLLCGGLSHLMLAAFEIMTEAGYNPRLAYYNCVHEPAHITKLFSERGLSGAFEKISATARYGALTRGPRIVDENMKRKMREIMEEIKSGHFACELKLNSNGEGFEALVDRFAPLDKMND